jgi:type IV pilus assembly protein PilE
MSLLEILVVTTIIAVLLSLAIPSYQRYVKRGQRADAIRSLLEITACQERIRASSGYYDTGQCLENRHNGFYRFTLEPAGQAASLAFTAKASPVDRASNDSCGSLSLDQSGTRGITGDSSRLAACWSGR